MSHKNEPLKDFLGREDFPEHLIEEFFIEAKENLDRAEQAAITLDQERTILEPIHEVFRSIHTIKGSASYLNLVEIKKLSHSFESLLDSLRHQKDLKVTDHLLDQIFEVIDALRLLIKNFAEKKTYQDVSGLIQSLDQSTRELTDKAIDVESISTSDSANPISVNPAYDVFRNSAEQQLGALEHCMTLLEQGNHQALTDIQAIVFRSLTTLSNSYEFMGEGEMALRVRQMNDEFQSQYVQNPNRSISGLISLLRSWIREVEKKLAEMADENKTSLEIAGSINEDSELEEPRLIQKRRNINPEAKTMRTDQVQIDRLMNLVGELVIVKNTLEHLQIAFDHQGSEQNQMSRELRQAVGRVAHLSSELQQTVRQIRLVPIRTVFQRLPRIMRDLNRQTGKNVSIQLEGEDTQIDKKIAEEIVDPLIHLVRNAVDHGIEPQEVRQKSRKSEEGKVVLRAYHRNQSIVIEVSDDGGGISIDAIKKKAIEKQIVSASDLETMADQEIIDLIFAPGFSTAKAISEISGRGVGLDVVRTNTQRMGGKIVVQSMPGEGTTMSMELPLTAAVLESILVQANQQLYAIPIQNVAEIIKVPVSEFNSIMHYKTIAFREEIIGVEYLEWVVGTAPGSHIRENEEKVAVVIIQQGSDRMGFIVDSINRTEEVVVKSIPPGLGDVPAVSGVSILGDGRAILILDPIKLIAEGQKASRRRLQIQEAGV